MPRANPTPNVNDTPIPPQWFAPIIVLSLVVAWLVALTLYFVNFPPDPAWLRSLREQMCRSTMLLWRRGYTEVAAEEYELEGTRTGGFELGSAGEETSPRGRGSGGQEDALMEALRTNREVDVVNGEGGGETMGCEETSNHGEGKDGGEVVEDGDWLEVIADGIGYVLDVMAGLSYSGGEEAGEV